MKESENFTIKMAYKVFKKEMEKIQREIFKDSEFFVFGSEDK